MSRVLGCMRCGHEGGDVQPKVVDLEAEYAAEGQRVRTVQVDLVTKLRHVEERTTVQVPERFGTEYRCRDQVACEARYAQQVATAQPETEEAPPWL